ncbi:tetratricopeptide repeat protein [Natronorubrum sp. A-ect3]|uniref:tetratricopeptide repeat protein n=1 Tax=Natronorubrum sp. A-ect3 TaxID=3242698 RepID=UPI00359CFB20
MSDRIIDGDLRRDINYSFHPKEVDSPDSILGDLKLGISLETAEITSPAFVEIHDEKLEKGEITLELKGADNTQGQIQIDTLGEYFRVPLLSGPVYFAVTKANQGEIEVAHDLIQSVYDTTKVEWEFREDCRDTISFDVFLNVMDQLAGHSHHYERILYRSATGYFAKRIDDRGPQQIRLFDVLSERVKKWNQSDQTESIGVDDVLAEYLGRNYVHDYLSNERDSLQGLGFDPIEYDPSWDSIVTAGWIAHLLLTDSEETVREFIRNRPIPKTGSYTDVKNDAKNSNWNRWRAWGNVLPLTVTEAEEEFHYDIYQYLRFAGKDYRGNGKICTLLYAAAAQLTGPLPAFFHQRIRFQELVSLGHDYRRDKNWEDARSAFQNAVTIASGKNVSSYDCDARKVAQATKSLRHTEATMLAIQGKESEAIEHYRSAVTELQQLGDDHNIDVEDHTQFLEGEMKKELNG